jgi:hypothetical protein
MASVDYEGTAHLSIVPQMPLDRFNIIARFRDAEAARNALQCLQAEHIPGEESSWLGYANDAVHAGSGLTEPDSKLVRAVARDMIAGGIAIGIAGAVVGMVLGIIPPLDSLMGAQASAETLGVGSVIGGLVGVTAGALIGGEAGFDRTQNGSDTYDDQVAEGAVLLGVHTDGDGTVEQVAQMLYGCGALDVRRFAPGEEPTA